MALAENEPPHPLRADPFALFCEYPTALLTPSSTLTRLGTADDLRRLRVSEIASPMPALLLDEEETAALLEALPDSLASLLAAASPEKHIPLYLSVGWLAKMGLIDVAPGDGGGAGEAPQFAASETWRTLSEV